MLVMIGRKKDEMLSNEEHEQMINRTGYDRQTLSSNDLRIKNKLNAWLDNIKDIRLILRNLPEDLTRDVLIDEYAFDLLHIAAEIMRLQKFLSISGEVDKPEEWQARGYGIVRLAEDKDIARNIILHSHLRNLAVFAGEIYNDEQNPAIRARAIDRLQGDSLLSAKNAPNEKKAIEKVKSALAKYDELQHLSELI
jgi:hypothetical protein